VAYRFSRFGVDEVFGEKRNAKFKPAIQTEPELGRGK
jgi:hypothetical protein